MRIDARLRCSLVVCVLVIGAVAEGLLAQQTGGYLTPPSPIPQILDAPPPPAVSVSPSGQVVAYLERSAMPTIEELAEAELRLAGVRINPDVNGPSRVSPYRGITFESIDGGERRSVDVPDARILFARWSPDGSRLAFVQVTPAGSELWMADAATGEARRLTDPVLNATLGAPFVWMPDGESLLVKRIPAGRGAPPADPAVPSGPVIQENLGRATPARTYQDLLTGPHDERLFEHYFTAQLALVPVGGGPVTPVGQPGIITDFSPSPSGEYVMVDRVKRPFSLMVPYYYFARDTHVIDLDGRVLRTVVDFREPTPAPIGRDMELAGPRSIGWRADVPATLVWAEALDGGYASRQMELRDRVLLLDAPFDGEPRTLIELDQRFAGIDWAREDLALVTSSWSTTARTKTFLLDPSRPAAQPRLLFDRSYEDSYGDPGSPVTRQNDAGFPVLEIGPGSTIYLAGEGASAGGVYPFLDRYDLETGEAERVWQAADPYYELLVELLDPEARRILTRRESATEPPNYFVRDLRSDEARALTDFPDPAPQLAGVERQVITYPREDGVLLSATLYLPPGYEPARDGPLPMLMWAYPREFRDAAAASQITESPNRFSRPSGASHLFLLTQGYAILDGPAVPIIGEGDEEPNDTYIEQLVSSMSAAVDEVVHMGVASRDRIGVGGHSYGAFMTANLLAHSDLFRAGIARSGAYNRSLTPFGFQAEPRTYWEATDVYMSMSPFNYAHQIDEPILLTHGEADNNSGTFPVQSERLYAALKGHGATVRYVVLPLESHGYAARESVMHTLAEMVRWMDTYVKNAAARAPDIIGARRGGGAR